MFPLWIAIAFLSFVTLFLAVEIPKQKSAEIEIEAERDVTSILAYRKGVIAYLQANPAATGTIPTTSLTTFWPLGYTNTGAFWSNYINPGDGKLYIFSSSPANTHMMSKLHKLYAESFFIGTKNAAGNFVSFNGSVTMPAPPAASIANGAVVIIGR